MQKAKEVSETSDNFPPAMRSLCEAKHREYEFGGVMYRYTNTCIHTEYFLRCTTGSLVFEILYLPQVFSVRFSTQRREKVILPIAALAQHDMNKS